MSCSCHTYNQGDAGPRIWVCPEHGRTGLLGVSLRFQQQDVFKEFADFWDFSAGVLQTRRAICRGKGEIYYDEDSLWTDVNKALMEVRRAYLPPPPPVKTTPVEKGARPLDVVTALIAVALIMAMGLLAFNIGTNPRIKECVSTSTVRN